MSEAKISIILDTETTGLKPNIDKIVEIGCIKLRDYKVVETYHQYINPECKIPLNATNIHGITDEFVKDMPFFKNIAQDFLNFIENHNIVAHNGMFDLGFLNAELDRCGFEKIKNDRLIDTLSMARQKFPNQGNKLEDLCVRYNIDKSKRVFHGALLDAELLSKVYLELCDAKQKKLDLSYNVEIKTENIEDLKDKINNRSVRKNNEDIIKSHQNFIQENFGENSQWNCFYNE